MDKRLLFFVFVSFATTVVVSAGELSSKWKLNGPSNSRIILEADEFAPAGINRAGVHIKLDTGWWTYWRAPGTSGIPPYFDWSGSKNVAGLPTLKWPIPIRAVAYGETLNLYRNEIVFPVAFKAANPALPVVLHLKLTYGICKNMCVPATVEHEVVLAPPKPRRQPRVSQANVRLISQFAERQPSTDPLSTGFEIREVWETEVRNLTQLGLRIQGQQMERRSLVLIEGPSVFKALELESKPLADSDESILMVSLGKSKEIRRLTGRRIRITIIDGKRALEQIWVVGTQSSTTTGTGLTPISSSDRTDRPQP